LFPYEDLEAVQEGIASSEWSHLSVIRTGFAIHLMEPHLSKGEGLTVLFEKMGWSMENALCVGDAPNDLSMFEVMRWSVAVGGAFPSVEEAADVRSPFAHGDTFPPLVDAILQRLRGGA
jgi:hydroxymethylpyrimidine pyrophosphatase-like HAD family hydrolase